MPELRAQLNDIDGLFKEADALLGSSADATAAYLGSLTILVREGLEALLVVVAMIAFLRKAERGDMLRYVHAGWAGALALGVVTWAVATYFVPRQRRQSRGDRRVVLAFCRHRAAERRDVDAPEEHGGRVAAVHP